MTRLAVGEAGRRLVHRLPGWSPSRAGIGGDTATIAPGELGRPAWLVLAALLAACCLVPVGYAMSWHYFVTGGQLLTQGAGGAHVYARDPQLQVGPLSLVAAAVLLRLPHALAQPAVLAAMSLAGLGVVAAAPAVLGLRASARTRLLGGLAFLPAWTEVSWHYGHLDDVLAVLRCMAALAAARANRPVVVSAAIAAATDAKPWAVVFFPLVLAGCPTRAQLLRAAAVGACVLGVAWLPFLLADPHTVTALRSFTISNAADSSLRAIGVRSARTPSWDRAAQTIVGLVLCTAVAARRRVEAVLLVGIASRLLLEPGTRPYYLSTLALACLVADLGLRPSRFPLLTTGCLVLVELPHHLLTHLHGQLLQTGAYTAGGLRAGFLAAALLTAVVPALPGRRWRDRLRHRWPTPSGEPLAPGSPGGGPRGRLVPCDESSSGTV